MRAFGLKRELAKQKKRITLIHARNYHLFQPLLYQVATAAHSSADFTQPIRSIVKENKNTRVIIGSVEVIDRDVKVVYLRNMNQISFDSF